MIVFRHPERESNENFETGPKTTEVDRRQAREGAEKAKTEFDAKEAAQHEAERHRKQIEAERLREDEEQARQQAERNEKHKMEKIQAKTVETERIIPKEATKQRTSDAAQSAAKTVTKQPEAERLIDESEEMARRETERTANQRDEEALRVNKAETAMVELDAKEAAKRETVVAETERIRQENTINAKAKLQAKEAAQRDAETLREQVEAERLISEENAQQEAEQEDYLRANEAREQMSEEVKKANADLYEKETAQREAEALRNRIAAEQLSKEIEPDRPNKEAEAESLSTIEKPKARAAANDRIRLEEKSINAAANEAESLTEQQEAERLSKDTEDAKARETEKEGNRLDGEKTKPAAQEVKNGAKGDLKDIRNRLGAERVSKAVEEQYQQEDDRHVKQKAEEDIRARSAGLIEEVEKNAASEPEPERKRNEEKHAREVDEHKAEVVRNESESELLSKDSSRGRTLELSEPKEAPQGMLESAQKAIGNTDFGEDPDESDHSPPAPLQKAAPPEREQIVIGATDEELEPNRNVANKNAEQLLDFRQYVEEGSDSDDGIKQPALPPPPNRASKHLDSDSDETEHSGPGPESKYLDKLTPNVNPVINSGTQVGIAAKVAPVIDSVDVDLKEAPLSRSANPPAHSMLDASTVSQESANALPILAASSNQISTNENQPAVKPSSDEDSDEHIRPYFPPPPRRDPPKSNKSEVSPVVPAPTLIESSLVDSKLLEKVASSPVSDSDGDIYPPRRNESEIAASSYSDSDANISPPIRTADNSRTKKPTEVTSDESGLDSDVNVPPPGALRRPQHEPEFNGKTPTIPQAQQPELTLNNSDPTSVVWFWVSTDKSKKGPLSFSDLKQDWIQGNVNENCYCWQSAMSEWLPISQVHTLMTVLSSISQSSSVPSAVSSLPSAVSSKPSWYWVNLDKSQQGPCSFEELKAAWSLSKLNENCYAWEPEMSSWQPIGKIPGLFSQLSTETTHSVSALKIDSKIHTREPFAQLDTPHPSSTHFINENDSDSSESSGKIPLPSRPGQLHQSDPESDSGIYLPDTSSKKPTPELASKQEKLNVLPVAGKKPEVLLEQSDTLGRTAAHLAGKKPPPELLSEESDGNGKVVHPLAGKKPPPELSSEESDSSKKSNIPLGGPGAVNSSRNLHQSTFSSSKPSTPSLGGKQLAPKETPTEDSDSNVEVPLPPGRPPVAPAPKIIATPQPVWYWVGVDKNQQGPCSYADLKAAWLASKVNEKCYAWEASMSSWQPIGKIPGLLSDLQPKVVPVAPSSVNAASTSVGSQKNQSTTPFFPGLDDSSASEVGPLPPAPNQGKTISTSDSDTEKVSKRVAAPKPPFSSKVVSQLKGPLVRAPAISAPVLAESRFSRDERAKNQNEIISSDIPDHFDKVSSSDEANSLRRTGSKSSKEADIEDSKHKSQMQAATKGALVVSDPPKSFADPIKAKEPEAELVKSGSTLSATAQKNSEENLHAKQGEPLQRRGMPSKQTSIPVKDSTDDVRLQDKKEVSSLPPSTLGRPVAERVKQQESDPPVRLIPVNSNRKPLANKLPSEENGNLKLQPSTRLHKNPIDRQAVTESRPTSTGRLSAEDSEVPPPPRPPQPRRSLIKSNESVESSESEVPPPAGEPRPRTVAKPDSSLRPPSRAPPPPSPSRGPPRTPPPPSRVLPSESSPAESSEVPLAPPSKVSGRVSALEGIYCF